MDDTKKIEIWDPSPQKPLISARMTQQGAVAQQDSLEQWRVECSVQEAGVEGQQGAVAPQEVIVPGGPVT